MNWNQRLRQLHRWTSIVFTLTVTAACIGARTTAGG
jgi:hypothetical protein